jgi:hypothetical protein
MINMGVQRSHIEADLLYASIACPRCARVNIVPTGEEAFRCLKCGSDLRLRDKLVLVERPRSRQRDRWIIAGVLGSVGIGLELYALVQDFLVDLPTLHRLGIPAWEWWLPLQHHLHWISPFAGFVAGFLGAPLLVAAAVLIHRARRRA